jgi:hypothetical protein
MNQAPEMWKKILLSGIKRLDDGSETPCAYGRDTIDDSEPRLLVTRTAALTAAVSQARAHVQGRFCSAAKADKIAQFATCQAALTGTGVGRTEVTVCIF